MNAAPITDEEIDAAFGELGLIQDAVVVEEMRRALEGFAAGRAAGVEPAVVPAERMPEAPWVPDMAHVANEWADVATSWLQWLRNIRDGISTVEAAIENTDAGVKHCMDVSAQAAAPQPVAQSAAQSAVVGPIDLHAAIMNLPCAEKNFRNAADPNSTYREGHRDARHAAAELVARVDHSCTGIFKRMTPMTTKNLDLARECGATDGIRLARTLHATTDLTMEFSASQLDAFAERIRVEADAELAEAKTRYALLHVRMREQDLLIARLRATSAPEVPEYAPAFDAVAFAKLTENGAKAWADVPDAAAWVDGLRGNTERKPLDAVAKAALALVWRNKAAPLAVGALHDDVYLLLTALEGALIAIGVTGGES